MPKKNRRRRSCMPEKPKKEEEEQLLSQEKCDEELNAVSQNISAVCQQLGSLSGPSTTSFGDLLERCALSLEELRILSELVGSETEAAKDAITSINDQLEKVQPLWNSIDKLVDFVALKKQQLTDLERLCTAVERKKRTVKKVDLVADIPIKHIEHENESDSDSDAPMEISSKKPDIALVAAPEPEMSLFEQVQAKKKAQEEKKAGKKEKEAEKKIQRKIRKVKEGQYMVKAKKAEFKVVTLNKGVKSVLEPDSNFKLDLLKARTSDRRHKDAKRLPHRSKWAGKASK